jgi:CheY-like chemotaxis protein
MKTKPTILFAEDSENDALLIELGFEKAGFPVDLKFVEDGALAVDYLTGRGRFADREKFPVPAAVVTDLKMPRMTGFELLAWMRGQEKWRNLPVIVVTGSDQAEDFHRAMKLGATCYVVKELLMRPPPALFDAILRYVTPVPSGVLEKVHS